MIFPLCLFFFFVYDNDLAVFHLELVALWQSSAVDPGCISQRFMQGAILALVIVMAFRSVGERSEGGKERGRGGKVCVDVLEKKKKSDPPPLPRSVISMSILYVLTLHHRGVDVTDKGG